MIELLLTSFPALIQYFRLKRKGEHITVWNMHLAVFAWLVLALALFMTIFYYHPKSFSGLVPFRLAPVVPQIGGPVTKILVVNGQHVSKGELLFTIEDSRQKIDVLSAKTKLGEVEAEFSVIKAKLNAVQGKVDSARASLKQTNEELARKETANSKNKNTYSLSEVSRLRNTKANKQGTLNAARSEYQAVESNFKQVLPAKQESAKAALLKAENELAKTEVRAFTNGTVNQIALNEGATATRLVLSPSLLIIPDQPADTPLKMTAGFTQTAKNVLKPGMPVEIACETNSNLLMRNVILPARISFIQNAIATGQITSGGGLIEPNSRIKRGSVLVHMELVHQEHEKHVLKGSGCIVQAYTNDLPGFGGHVISALGAVKAILFRIKVWVSLAVGIGLASGGK